MKRIAIAGANGLLGNEVLQAFHHAGYQVSAITRTGQVRNAPKGVRRVAADAMNLHQLKKAVRGADFIFNGLKAPYASSLQAALPMARNVMEAARSTGAVQLFPGNLHVYGQQIPELCTADTPMQSTTTRGKVSIEMERLFALAAEKYRLQTLVIRCGDAYGGSGQDSWFKQTLTEKIDSGQFVYPGPVDRVHAWTYLPDLAQAFVALADNVQRCQAFEHLLYPGHSLTGAELQVLLEQASGRELQQIGLPWRLIRAGRFLVPAWRELTETAYLWSQPHRLSGDRLTQLTGQLTATPPAQGVRAALQAAGE